MSARLEPPLTFEAAPFLEWDAENLRCRNCGAVLPLSITVEMCVVRAELRWFALRHKQCAQQEAFAI